MSHLTVRGRGTAARTPTSGYDDRSAAEEISRSAKRRNVGKWLGAAGALSLLLSMTAFAATTLAYLVTSKTISQFGIISCGSSYSFFEGSTPPDTQYCAQFAGNINTTQVAGTQPAYLACIKQTNTFGNVVCGGSYSVITGSLPNPNTYLSSLIGYAHSSAVAGTSATYFACPLVTNQFGVVSCGGYQIIKGAAPNPSTYHSWLIGYINP